MDYRKHLNRAASRNSAADLTLNDIAECVADAVKSSEHRVLEHVGRVVKLINAKADARDETTRLNNFHRRLCAIESELRRMARGQR